MMLKSQLNKSLCTALAAVSALSGCASRATGLEGSSPGLTQQEIEDSMKKVQPYLMGCYSSGLQQKPGLAGTFTIDFRVTDAGRVINAKAIDGETTLMDPSTRSCLLRSVLTARFPKPRNTNLMYVTYPMSFHPEILRQMQLHGMKPLSLSGSAPTARTLPPVQKASPSSPKPSNGSQPPPLPGGGDSAPPPLPGLGSDAPMPTPTANNGWNVPPPGSTSAGR